MARITISAQEVAKSKACSHPSEQLHTITGYLADKQEYYSVQVCSVCSGVLESGILVHPLYPREVLVGRNEENIKAAQIRAGMRT